VGELSGVCHSETFFAGGEPGQRSGSKKALQIDYEVESTAAKQANKGQQEMQGTGMKPGFAKKLSVEKDSIRQMRMIFQKRSELGTDEPTDLCVRKAVAQSVKGGQSHDNVTERAGLYYQDVFEAF